MSRKLVWSASLLLALSTRPFADVITLKDGRVLEGEIVQDDDKGLKIKLKGGALSIDRKDVASIQRKSTPAQEYKERLAKLNVTSAGAQAELGVWAGSQGLDAEAVQHCLEAWKLDPTLKAASDELERQDYHLESGAWKSPDAYYPVRGYLKLDGHWYKPLEHAWRSSMKEVEVRTTARSEAKAVLAAAQAKLAKAETQKSVDEARIESMEVENQNAEAAIVEGKSAISAAESDVTTAQAELNSASGGEGSSGGSAELKNKIKEGKRKLAAAEAALGKANRAVATLEATIKSNMAEIEKTRLALPGRDSEKARAAEEVTKRTEDVRRAEDAVRGETARAQLAKEAWEKSK
jgi:hypothetical protein